MREKPSKAHCQDLMRRLRRLPFSGDPSDATGAREEVGETLLRVAVNDAHASRIVDALMRRLHAFPVPADVLDEANASRVIADRDLSPDELYGPAPVLCERCHGFGSVRNESGLFEACTCPDPAPPEHIAELNRLWPRVAGPRRERLIGTTQFLERAGLL